MLGQPTGLCSSLTRDFRLFFCIGYTKAKTPATNIVAVLAYRVTLHIFAVGFMFHIGA